MSQANNRGDASQSAATAKKLTLASSTLTAYSGVVSQRAMSAQRSAFGCTPSASSKAFTRTLNFPTFTWQRRHAHEVADLF